MAQRLAAKQGSGLGFRARFQLLLQRTLIPPPTGQELQLTLPDIPLWVDSGAGSEDDGAFAFARATPDGKSFAVIVTNASDEPRVTAIKDQAMHLPKSLQAAGKVLRPALTIGIGNSAENLALLADGQLHLPAPKSTLVIYESINRE